MKLPAAVLPAVLLSLSQLLVAPAFAQDSRVSELERRLDQNLKLIQELSARIKQLEAAAASSSNADPKVAQELSDLRQQVTQMTSARSHAAASAEPGLPLHGFADVGAGMRRGGPKGFATGSLDFYLTPQFGDRVRALFEPLIEFNSDGVVGLDLERAQIGYAFGDAFTLWGGRFHTPYGSYNTSFHHGQLMQTSIKKPKFIDFEDKGGIVPAHTVGIWGTGKFNLGASKFTYDVYVGNSPSLTGDALDMNNSGTRNHNASTGANLGYHLPGSLESMKVGAHYYRARVNDRSDPANVTKISFAGPYAVYDDGVWESFFEYYSFNNDNVESNTAAPAGRHRSRAWFAQLGRHFGSWMPYARYERSSLDQDDNYFALQSSGRSYTRSLGGLRYDLNPKAALTVELNHTKQDDPLPTYNEIRIQYAIGF